MTFSTSVQAKLNCAYLNYYPYAFVEEGHPSGTVIEILKNIDNNIFFEILPPARLIMMIEKSELDCGMLSSIALSSKSWANYNYLPIHAVDTYIFYLKSEGKLSYFDFREKKVAVIRGVKKEKKILVSKYGINTFEVDSPTQAINMLKHGRVKGIHMSLSSISNHEAYDPKLITFISDPAIKVTVGYFIHKKEKKKYENLKRKSESFFKTKKYKNILKKYLKKDFLVQKSLLN